MISKQTLLTDKTTKTEKNMPLYINYGNAPDVLKSKLKALSPTPGYCVFIDVSNATALKDEGSEKLITLIGNTFQNIAWLLAPLCYPLKYSDGAFMFFIPENDLTKVGPRGYKPLSFFDDLQTIVSGEERHCLPAKAGVVFSTNVSISFTPGADNIRGDDFDLASCLMSDAKSKQIVMNKAFYDKVKYDYDSASNKQQFACFTRIFEYPVNIEGDPGEVTVYKFPGA